MNVAVESLTSDALMFIEFGISQVFRNEVAAMRIFQAYQTQYYARHKFNMWELTAIIFVCVIQGRPHQWALYFTIPKITIGGACSTIEDHYCNWVFRNGQTTLGKWQETDLIKFVFKFRAGFIWLRISSCDRDL